ncbi:30S ribosomal protein S19e [Halalkalicoccus sp. NIPERK01]|uniref:30S ribosomal protein S19e n=1 Tax=Halalkalicoccus sp. NIPERK01 TaxID=3053469 RepID=UPI00256F5567|nr:30S ribosomal protein S19e [Halalkalicoccus sp. NIPERK01]MDL5362353.1 30S ribosomal protein S19e [Halalkalicoccus sp. NIPERK01]
MTTLYDVPADELIEALSDRLDDRIDQPEWAAYAKTGASRELPPEREDFWTVRAASLLRKVAVDGPVGVERLATHYGSAKRGSNRYTVAPPKQTDASDNLIRTILQQLEDEGLVSQQGDAGRVLTAEGRSLLDETAGEVLAEIAAERPELERYA